jgi:hypothetical protein
MTNIIVWPLGLRQRTSGVTTIRCIVADDVSSASIVSEYTVKPPGVVTKLSSCPFFVAAAATRVILGRANR